MKKTIILFGIIAVMLVAVVNAIDFYIQGGGDENRDALQISSAQPRVQSFKLGIDSILSRIYFAGLDKTNSGTLNIKITDASSVVCSSVEQLDASEIIIGGYGSQDNYVTFSTPCRLDANTEYRISFEITGALALSIQITDVGTYPDGEIIGLTGDMWLLLQYYPILDIAGTSGFLTSDVYANGMAMSNEYSLFQSFISDGTKYWIGIEDYIDNTFLVSVYGSVDGLPSDQLYYQIINDSELVEDSINTFMFDTPYEIAGNVAVTGIKIYLERIVGGETYFGNDGDYAGESFYVFNDGTCYYQDVGTTGLFYGCNTGDEFPADDGSDLTMFILTEPVITCTEDWLPEYSPCNVSDEQVLTYYDNNSCGTFENLPVNNGTTESCNYCTISYTENNPDCVGGYPVEVTYSYNNYNTCCALTGIPADCDLPANHTRTCVGLHSSSDIAGVVIDGIVTLGAEFVKYAPLVAIMTILGFVMVA